MELSIKRPGNKISILLLTVLMLGLKVQAQKISVSNGSWSNPAIWFPFGVPLSSDGVVVNHDIVLDTDISFSTFSSLTIRKSKSLTEDLIPRRINITGVVPVIDSGTIVVSYWDQQFGILTNYDSIHIKKKLFTAGNIGNSGRIYVADTLSIGTTGSLTNQNASVVTTDNFLYNNGTVINNGSITADYIRSGMSFENNDTVRVKKNWVVNGVFNNFAYAYIKDTLHVLPGPGARLDNYIVVTTDNFLWIEGTFGNSGMLTASSITISPSGTLNNNPNGIVVTTDNFIFNDGTINVYNLSSMRIKNLISTGTINGAYGCINVSDSSNVSGSIFGPIDFCDATPPADSPFIDVFTGTISPDVTFCTQICSVVGIKDQPDQPISVVVYPNPVTDEATLLMTIKEKGVYLVEVYDVVGRKVYGYSVEINSMDSDYQFNVPCRELQQGSYLLTVKKQNIFYKTLFLKMKQ